VQSAENEKHTLAESVTPKERNPNGTVHYGSRFSLLVPRSAAAVSFFEVALVNDTRYVAQIGQAQIRTNIGRIGTERKARKSKRDASPTFRTPPRVSAPACPVRAQARLRTASSKAHAKLALLPNLQGVN
jgi:hypothetical protein